MPPLRSENPLQNQSVMKAFPKHVHTLAVSSFYALLNLILRPNHITQAGKSSRQSHKGIGEKRSSTPHAKLYNL
jgi:hypothetical protein